MAERRLLSMLVLLVRPELYTPISTQMTFFCRKLLHDGSGLSQKLTLMWSMATFALLTQQGSLHIYPISECLSLKLRVFTFVGWLRGGVPYPSNLPHGAKRCMIKWEVLWNKIVQVGMVSFLLMQPSLDIHLLTYLKYLLCFVFMDNQSAGPVNMLSIARMITLGCARNGRLPDFECLVLKNFTGCVWARQYVHGVISPNINMCPSAKPRLLIIQPALMHYRTLVYNVVNQSYDTTVLCSAGSVEGMNQKFPVIEVPVFKILGFTWQRNVIKSLIELRPHAVWIAADVNVLSSLTLVIYCWWRGIATILHGQGLIKQSRMAWLRRVMLKFWISLADRYVGYTEGCTQSLVEAGVNPGKLLTISNRLECASGSARISPDSNGVLFVGRLRSGCRIDWLVNAMVSINNSRSLPIPLHIIGDGQEGEAVLKMSQTYSWIKSHGSLTDHSEIKSIAEKCSVGAYPGMAGLSVLTYMQNGLAVVVGSDLSNHMGPEPGYVINHYNGWTFEDNNYNNFRHILEEALDSPKLPNIRMAACATFDHLHRISYGEEMGEAISASIATFAKM